MNSLIEKAREQLETGDPYSLRRTCWLARTALEGVVRQLLDAKGVAADRASERARLSCLEGVYLDHRDLAHKADFAWSRLSEACHQHAYELAPTYAEVQHLVVLVEELAGLSQKNHEEAS